MLEILRDGSERSLAPRVDWVKIDATTEEEIATQIGKDEAETMRDGPPKRSASMSLARNVAS